jgi:hypothetical protein
MFPFRDGVRRGRFAIDAPHLSLLPWGTGSSSPGNYVYYQGIYVARLTSRQKSERVLHLLMGLRDAATASALVSVGFRDGDLQEGWALLRRTTREGIDPKALPRPGPVPSPRTMQAPLEAWQNRWWPVVEATLHRHTPDLARGVAEAATPAKPAAIPRSKTTGRRRRR